MKSTEFLAQLIKSWEKVNNLRKEEKNKPVEIKAFNEFWFTIDNNNYPGLRIKLDQNSKFQTKNIPKAKGWGIFTGKNLIEMHLSNKNHIEFFIKIVNLIITKIFIEKISGDKSIECFFENLISAKDFFEDENIPKKLTPESQIGLFGEIFVLSKILNKKLSNKNSLLSWTGPSKKHDFTTNKILIETKTTVTESKIVNTSSTNQIAPVFEKELFLFFLQLKKNSAGLSLNEIINVFSEILKNESDLLYNEFLLKLVQSKYFEIHKKEYNEKYMVDKINYYEVRDDFPYIKKINVPDAISDLSITYKIDLEKCVNFKINEEKVLEKL
jgi:hypothetical protein|tara:strand:+ start:272 stop:1252 length:981 start_codon:yes stop_codon:yes gene_type:complete